MEREERAGERSGGKGRERVSEGAWGWGLGSEEEPEDSPWW